MKQLLSLALFSAAALWAADPAGFVHWTAAQLKAYEKTLAPKVNPQKFAGAQIGKWGNHYAMMSYREGDGESEIHEKVTDVFIVQSGVATLVVGGKLVGGRTTEPGELRGKSIEGGVRRKLGPGDVAHIPANTPHQVLLEPGRKFTYMILKVNE